jgi:hypothetical protein
MEDTGYRGQAAVRRDKNREAIIIIFHIPNFFLKNF